MLVSLMVVLLAIALTAELLRVGLWPRKSQMAGSTILFPFSSHALIEADMITMLFYALFMTTVTPIEVAFWRVAIVGAVGLLALQNSISKRIGLLRIDSKHLVIDWGGMFPSRQIARSRVKTIGKHSGIRMLDRKFGYSTAN